MTVRVRIALWLIASLVLTACASAPQRDPNAPKVPLLLVPLNFDYAVADHLNDGLEILADEVVAQAEEAGFRCERVPLAEVLKLWPGILEETGWLVQSKTSEVDMARLATARGELVKRLAADRSVAGVLLPTLVVREGVMKNGRVKWDGVYRRPPIAKGLIFDKERLNWSGKMPAMSLWTSLYTLAGDKVSDHHGGLEILLELRPRHTDLRHQYYDWKERKDLFSDRGNIRKGVGLSLDPVLRQAHRAL